MCCAAAGPAFALISYVALTVALGVLSCFGIPCTSEGCGALVFLSAFPLLFLNERRFARMVQLLRKTVQMVTVTDGIYQANEGRLVMIVGPLQTSGEEKLAINAWGVNAPSSSAGVRVEIEQLQPISRYSPLRLCCYPGTWGPCDRVASEEAKASTASVGGLLLSESALSGTDSWSPFVPVASERFADVLRGYSGGEDTANEAPRGCCATAARGFANTLGFHSLPFPDERPLQTEGGTQLYYQRAGTALRPAVGDVRVRFLHLPCGPEFLYTAIGVQRGGRLEPFKYRDVAPSGCDFGEAHFNTDDEERTPQLGEKWLPVSQDVRDNDQLGKGTSPTAGGRFALLLAGLSASAEAWRWLLHYMAPERLRELVPGSKTRCSYVLHVFYGEAVLTWWLRFCGFSVMCLGIEIALWKWQLILSMFGGLLGAAVWVIALVGAGGFTACTVAAASMFYQPVSAVLTLAAGVALFCAIFGTTTLFIALSVVGVCMVLVGAFMMIHLLLPC